MQYLGGKTRIAKQLAAVINEIRRARARSGMRSVEGSR